MCLSRPYESPCLTSPPEDPRQVRSRAAIQAAAARLLTDEGPTALTHQRVAQESGVGRATVYRHWPTTRGLLLDAVLGSDLPFFVDPVVPVRPGCWPACGRSRTGWRCQTCRPRR